MSRTRNLQQTDQLTYCQPAAFVRGIVNDFTVFAFQEQVYHVLACSIVKIH